MRGANAERRRPTDFAHFTSFEQSRDAQRQCLLVFQSIARPASNGEMGKVGRRKQNDWKGTIWKRQQAVIGHTQQLWRQKISKSVA
jgi:hypothetical protein